MTAPTDRSRARDGRAGLRAAVAALLAATQALPDARGSERHDHERARAAVEAGEVLPWPTLHGLLRSTYPGQVLELELERDDGRWIYEVKLLQAGGHLLKLKVDAATGRVIESRRKTVDAASPVGQPSR